MVYVQGHEDVERMLDSINDVSPVNAVIGTSSSPPNPLPMLIEFANEQLPQSSQTQRI